MHLINKTWISINTFVSDYSCLLDFLGSCAQGWYNWDNCSFVMEVAQVSCVDLISSLVCLRSSTASLVMTFDFFPVDATSYDLVFTDRWRCLFLVFIRSLVSGPNCFTAVCPAAITVDVMMMSYTSLPSCVPAEIQRCWVVCGKCWLVVSCDLVWQAY